jgi:hypothetical protein
MKRLFTAIILAGIMVSGACAQTVQFILQADLLKTSTGSALPTDRLLLLVADTAGDGFGSLTDGSTLALNDFFAGDDRIIWRDDLSFDAIPGVYQKSTGTLTLNGGWNAGDAVALIWFETLTLATSELTTGDRYGLYTHATGLDGSNAWTTPPSGSPELRFYTSDSSTLFLGGSNAAILGRTNDIVVVPEPSTYALLGAGLVGMWAFRRRKT